MPATDSVNNSTNGYGPNAAAPKVPNNNLSADDFMKLFVTQLQNQNPLQPMDSTAMLNQMAQIGSINASKDMTDTVHGLANQMQAVMSNSQVLNAAQLIGKEVVAYDPNSTISVSPLTIKDGGKDKDGNDIKIGHLGGSVLLTEPAQEVTVYIKDMKTGKEVKKIQLGPAPTKGLVDFNWDGIDETSKQLLEGGAYQISASATVKGGDKPMPAAGSFQVKSIAANPVDGKLVLNLDILGGKNLEDIVKIL
jgi:flagellar basal-body rod modification protein FlgD